MTIAEFGQVSLPNYPEHVELDPESAAIVAQAKASPSTKWWDQPIAVSRAEYRTMIEQVGLPPCDIADHVEFSIARQDGTYLPLHIYRPRNSDTPPICTILFFRGSGMCMGDMTLYDSLLQQLSFRAHALVVAPDYRLAPEHPYPAGHDDAYEAFTWLVSSAGALGVDAAHIVVGGDSAGGMLAAATCLRARLEHPGAIAMQLLIAPALGTQPLSRSVQQYSQGYLLDVEDLAWLYQIYTGGIDRLADPLVYPIHATDLGAMPPTLMITAGSDVMREDAEAFARRLHSAGIAVELLRFEQTIHPFFNMGGVITACDKALDHIGNTLRRAFR
jgi:acetyl esterase